MASGRTQTFASGDVNHRVIRVAQQEVPAGDGKARQTIPPLVYEFDQGLLVIDDKVRERDRAFFEQWRGVFDYGREDHSKPDLPAEEWLRQHQSFGIPGAWGFHEVEGAVADTVQAEVTEAVLAGDTDRLLALYQQEEAGANRPDVLDQIERALRTLEERQGAPAG